MIHRTIRLLSGRPFLRFVAIASVLWLPFFLWGEEPPARDDSLVASPNDPADVKTQTEALAEFNSLIGGWRGVGQPKRGSNQGAWAETAEWVWDFSNQSVAIRYSVKKGKLLSSALLSYAADSKEFVLNATLADDTRRTYRGKLDGEKLELDSEPDKDGNMHRLTVTRLNPKRTLVLFEKRRGTEGAFARVAQVGYTREGTRLAEEGAGQPQCVLTGGAGTIKVSHKGKTYYVCCTGCQQAFEADPDGIIADYEARLAEKNAKAED